MDNHCLKVLPSSKSLPKVENDPFYDVSLFWTHNQLRLRYQNGYIAIIFLCMTDNFALKFDFNLFMFDIKVLTNGVQFLTNYHENNVAIIHFKNYLLKSSFEYIYIIINLVFQGCFFSCGYLAFFSSVTQPPASAFQSSEKRIRRFLLTPHSLPSLGKLQKTPWQWGHMQAGFIWICVFMANLTVRVKWEKGSSILTI